MTLTETHRQAQIALRNAIVAQVVKLWPRFDVRNPATWPPLLAALIALVLRGNEVSASLAANYFTEFRAAEGVAGDAFPQIAETPPAQQIVTALSVTGLFTINRLLAADVDESVAADIALIRVTGSVGRLVLLGGRETLLRSVEADKRAKGYRRVTSGRPCEFCDMLAGRGAVYSAATVDFAAHDHCSCAAEPAY